MSDGGAQTKRLRLDPRKYLRYKKPTLPVVTKEDAVIPTEEILLAIKQCQGIIYKICMQLGISRLRFFGIAKKDKTILNSLVEEREGQLDLSESKLFELRDTGNLGAVIFHLKTQGRKRGWKEKDDGTDSDRPPVAINIKPAKGAFGSFTVKINQDNVRDAEYTIEEEGGSLDGKNIGGG